MIKSRQIIIGVTGGIAAYKSAEIVSYLHQQNACVTVVMTESATRFITPLTFQTLSHNRVYVGLFEAEESYDPQHISLAEKTDLVVIAPATANIIGKIAHGIADDLLSTIIMVVKAPVLVAPAMNANMYRNPIVQENVKKLKKSGYTIIEPEEGYLACGKTGPGRMAAPDKIIAAIESILKSRKK
ncbi:MAG: bifunctional phosphopantothenoylcysteine decarboxylase/phosphopantothenate--cysteine ligase CoaBC [Planctomycetota bacterium]